MCFSLSSIEVPVRLEALKNNFNADDIYKIAFPVSDGLMFVEVENISFLEADGSYCTIWLNDNSKILVSKKLKYFDDLLKNRAQFYRIHRSSLININAIQKYSKADSHLVLNNNKIVKISRDKKADFEQYIKTVPAFASKEAELEYFSTKFSYKKEDGKVVGKHQGAHYFTKGQRKGLNVGGTKEALYVIETDVNENIIYTGEGKNHQGLYRNVLFVSNEELHWVREDLKLKSGESIEVEARIRYRQQLEKATIHKVDKGMYVAFKNKQSAIQEGQFVAWYNNEELLGSGVIS